MRSGITQRRESWTVNQRILAWHMPLPGESVEKVRLVDQTREPEPVVTAEDQPAGASPEKSYSRWCGAIVLVLVGLVRDFLSPFVTILRFVYWGVGGLLSLLVTPFVLALRAARVMRWRLDVRVDDVLVDKQFVRGTPAAQRRMDEIGDQLRAGRFRTTHPGAVVTAEPDVTTV